MIHFEEEVEDKIYNWEVRGQCGYDDRGLMNVDLAEAQCEELHLVLDFHEMKKRFTKNDLALMESIIEAEYEISELGVSCS